MAKLRTSDLVSINSSERYNPFPGLRSFEPAESHLFFGREKQMAELLRKLRATHFLAILGNSGSGKSSMIKCGLLPRLKKGFAAQAGSQWRIATFRPGVAPLGNMSWELAKANAAAQDEIMEPGYPAQIEEVLRSGTLGLVKAFEQAEMKQGENLLLVIDQFEEIFKYHEMEKRYNSTSNDAFIFVNLLLAAVRQKNLPIYIVITMRSDFLGNSTEFRGLPEIINDGQFLMPRMQRDEIKRAIVGPLGLVGVGMTPRLVSRLLNDVGEKADELPLLQHALMRMFDFWEQKGNENAPIDTPHYEAIGTITHALDIHAEEAYAELDDDGKVICEGLFRSITEKGADGRGTSRPTKVKDIAYLTEAPVGEVAKVLQPFGQQGRTFVNLSEEDVDGDTIVSLSHESLMRVWTRLSAWVDEELTSSEIYFRLAKASELYYAGQSGLWRDPELQFGLNWYNEQSPNKMWADRYGFNFEKAIDFLNESQRAQQREIELEKAERAQKLQRAKRIAQISGLAVLICLSLVTYALVERNRASHAMAESERSAQKAQLRTLDAHYNMIKAKEAEQKAEEEAEHAHQAELDADAARKRAVDALSEAGRAKVKAEEEAKRAEKEAERAETEAEKAKEAEKDAIRKKEMADSLALVAKDETEKAEKAEEKTKELSILSEAQAVAVKSQKMAPAELQALYAQVAYYLIVDKDKRETEPYVYDGLYNAINTFERKKNGKDFDYNLFSRGHNGVVSRIVRLPSGRILSIGRDGVIYRWLGVEKDGFYDSSSALRINPSDYGRSFRHAAVSPSDEWMAVGDASNQIHLYEISALEAYANRTRRADILPSPDYHTLTAIAMLPGKDGVVAAYGSQGDIKITPISKGGQWSDKTVSLPESTRTSINALCHASKGKYLFGAGADGHLYRWDLSTRKQLSRIQVETPYDPRNPVSAVCAISAGRLVVGMEDGSLYIYNVAKGEIEKKVGDKHQSRITSLTYRPGSPYVISTSLDRSAKIWDISKMLRTNSYVPIGLNHPYWAMTADFFEFEGGKPSKIITGIQNGELKVWPMGTTQLSEVLCGLLDGKISKEDLDQLLNDININKAKYKETDVSKKMEGCYGKIQD